MYKLLYSDQAKEDLITIATYIAKESGSVETALQFTTKLETKCERLAEIPGEVGRTRNELEEGLRSFPVGNYIIFFAYKVDVMKVVTIVEGHRDMEALFISETEQ